MTRKTCSAARDGTLQQLPQHEKGSLEGISSDCTYIFSSSLICVQIPVTKDVCIFCLSRIQFASVHALRRPQRRFLNSTHSLHRPPTVHIAQKEDDGPQESDSAQGSQPPQPFGGGWATTRRAEPSDLTPEEIALRNGLLKNHTRKPVVPTNTSPQEGQKGTSQESRIRRNFVTENPEPLRRIHPTQQNERNGVIQGNLSRSFVAKAHVPLKGTESKPYQTRLAQQNKQDGTMQKQRSHSYLRETRGSHQESELKRKNFHLQDGRFNDPTPTETSQVNSIIKNPEDSNPPMLQFRPFTQPLPTSESQISQRLSSGGWAKSEVTTDLTSDERALRQDLLDAATPKASLPGHRTNHSPHKSSVQGYQSRQDLQTEGAPSEEIADVSPVQSSSTQKQLTHESTDQPASSDYHQVRDAQLTRQIPFPSEAPEVVGGPWYCSSCATHNLRRESLCTNCRTLRPFGRWECGECGVLNDPSYYLCQACHSKCSVITSQAHPENAKHWRHLKHAGSDISLKGSQLEQISTPGRLGDTQAILGDIEAIARDTRAIATDTDAMAMARAIEREKTERMERTKSGDFVGLRSQNETATTKAMQDSYWSLEANGSQVPHIEQSHSSTPDKPESVSGLIDSQAQHAGYPQVKEMREVRDTMSVHEAPLKSSENGPSTARLTGGWKRWTPSAGEQPPFEELLFNAQSTENTQVKIIRETGSSREAPDQSLAGRPKMANLTDGWNGREPFSAGQPPFEEPSPRRSSDQSDRSTYPSPTELEHAQKARELNFHVRERKDRTRREPEEPGIARQLLHEGSVRYTKDNDRDRMRKSKKVVSAYEDMDEEDEGRAARRMERKEQKKRAKASKKAVAAPTPIYLPEFISVSNLAGVLRVRIEDFIRKMKEHGFEETSNDLILDAETAGLIAAEFNFEPVFEQAENTDLLPRPSAEDKSMLPPRPPVVTIMGHVDHGKTTLLDYLRKSSVAASEHGGITQHIGAFSVPMPGGRLVTFLDTPGHEAFLSMRQRGANVTDIVILVVAADDSVKPQTIEAIRHAQAARVPMIVAINKIDKEDSNAERVKQDLARYGVEVEDYGGDTQAVCVSGKTGQGMEELEDAAVALADILDMRSETDGQAEGWVLEATTKKSGRVATVLVRRGTLRPSDIIVAGTSWARVRSLRNEAGVMLKSAGPGTPVEIDGWREQPSAGDEVLQARDEQRAKAVVNYRLEAYERTRLAGDMAAVNEARRLEQEKREESERAAELAKQSSDAAAADSAEAQSTAPTQSFQEVFFIVKADVSGSVEAVTNAVSALGNSEVRPHILRTGVGPVTESDIDHAAVAKGHIISFNTTVDGNMQRTAEANEVVILSQSIIYRLVDDVKAKLSEKLPDVVTQKVVGEAEIAQVFEINTKGRIRVPVAGCRVKNGVVGRNNKVRVLRGKETIFDGMLFCSMIPVPVSVPFADLILPRYALVPQERQKGRHGDAKGHRVWYQLRQLDRLQTGRPGAVL